MYEINGSAINEHAINGNESGAAFSAEGSGSAVFFEDSIELNTTGTALYFEDEVAIIGSGDAVLFEDTITLRLTGSGNAVYFEDSIENSGIGNAVYFEDRIRDSSLAVFYNNLLRFGWDAYLYVGGAEIPANQIHGSITITRNENSAALMDVTLINRTGIQDFTIWHGKTVTLDIETENGITRVYTGVVDIPDIDLIAESITLRCTDRRTEQINEQLAAELPFIGYWSNAVFDTPDDVAEELSQRLLTTTKTVDFDAYGNYTISDYLPKATPDFTLNDASIYRRKPTVQLASRGRLVNRVNVEFEYRYTRLRHRERTFNLEGPSFCDVMTTPGLAFLRSDSIESNIDSFGWALKPGSTSYEYLPDAGWYDCGDGKFIWSPIVTTGTVTQKRDEDGNIIYDSNGNAVTEMINKTITDYTETFALSASWVAAKRWAQDITEKSIIQVSAPQSIAQYGVIEQTQRNGHDVDYDASDYEREDSYKSPTDMISSAGDYYLDKSGTAADYRAALFTVISMAETKIIKSHRDYHVSIQTPIWPEVDLKHTVATTAGLIQSKGKVSQITHTLDITNRFAETQVQLSLSKAQGTQSAGSVTLPILSAPLVGGFDVNTLTMYTYEGSIPEGGLTGSGYEVSGFGYGASPQQAVGMITPAIDDESRNRQIVENSVTYDIPLRDDTLIVTF